MKSLIAIALTAILTGNVANAALYSRLDGQAVYDSNLNITWLADANLAFTNTFGLARNVDLGPTTSPWSAGQSVIDSNGSMTWGGAVHWINAMNAANHLGFSDWRLPSTRPVNGASFNYSASFNGTTDIGYNVGAPDSTYAGSHSSEMAYLFFSALGDKAICSPFSLADTCTLQSGWGLSNVGTFTNFQSSYYWSGSEYAPYEFMALADQDKAWGFTFGYGSQSISYKGNYSYALAVRNGDVASVPIPAAVWLLGSSMLGFASVARRKRK